MIELTRHHQTSCFHPTKKKAANLAQVRLSREEARLKQSVIDLDGVFWKKLQQKKSMKTGPPDPVTF